MPHVHELIDFVVVAYIVHGSKVLLINHKAAGMWLPVGGHVELDEDPEEALVREIREESGLDVELIGGLRPAAEDVGTKPLLAPLYMDIHATSHKSHRHIGLVYFARSETDRVTLAAGEHNDIRWFTRDELSDSTFGVRPYVRFYAEAALERLSSL